GDDGGQADERGSGIGTGRLDGGVEGLDVLFVLAAGGEVHVLNVPAVGGVAGGRVLTEGVRGVVLDRDPVVVPDHQQIRQFLRPRRGWGRTGPAFLEVAVGGERDDRVVERRGAGRSLGVEQSAFPAGRHGHAHRRGESRAQGPRGALDTGGVPDLWVAGSQGTPGAQRLEVIELEPEPGQIELNVLRERTVAAGENETIPTDPGRVGRIV